uniref:Tail protein n=1 Tax=viral metagenome TaxID=1070528 RepID=A0A6M3JSV9_9ZZZZ
MATVLNKVASYLVTLTASNIICSALGTTLRLASTLFLGQEPNKDNDTVTLIPYPGEPPDYGGYKYTSSVQVRVKVDDPQVGLNTQQAFIRQLHMNSLGGRGMMVSVNSAPLCIGSTEGGEKQIYVTSYYVRHIRP